MELCRNCGDRKVAIKKWRLCYRCYCAMYRAGYLSTKSLKIKNQGSQYQLFSRVVFERPPFHQTRVPAYQKRKRLKNALSEKYGNEILKDLIDLDSKHYWNLTGLAIKYSVSRERARQWYTMLNGHGFRETRSEKANFRNKELSCSRDPRHKVAESPKDSTVYKGASAEVDFMNRCAERGFIVEVPCKVDVDLKINNYLVDVKTSAHLFHAKGAKIPYYHYAVSVEQQKKADFIAAYHPVEDTFFIIPMIDLIHKASGKSKSIYILQHKSNYRTAKNRYWEYKDAWHLLEKKHD